MWDHTSTLRPSSRSFILGMAPLWRFTEQNDTHVGLTSKGNLANLVKCAYKNFKNSFQSIISCQQLEDKWGLFFFSARPNWWGLFFLRVPQLMGSFFSPRAPIDGVFFFSARPNWWGLFFLHAPLWMDGWMDGPWEVIHVVGKRVWWWWWWCSFCVFVYGIVWLKPSILRWHNDVYQNPFKLSKVKVKERPVEMGKVKLEDYEIT